MKILALGGAGQQGSTAVRALLEFDDVEKVVVADINLAAATELKASVVSEKVEALELDVLNPSSLRQAISEVDVVANFVGPFYRFSEPVVKMVIECGKNYVDICDDAVPTVHLLDNYHDAAVKAGSSILLGMGASPGLMNVLVRKAADNLDEVEEVNMYWAVSANDIETDLSSSGGNAAIYEHALELVAENTTQYIDGQYHRVAGGSELEPAEFEALGEQQVYFVSHPEPSTIPRYIKLNRAVNKGCVPGLDEILFGLRDLGLTLHDKMLINGTEIEAAKVGVAVLAHLDAISEPVPTDVLPACSDLYVTVKGVRDDKAVIMRIDAIAEHGALRMDALTGLSAAVGILMMGRGQVKESGVWPPEACIEPENFLEQLKDLGILCSSKCNSE